MSWTDPKNRWLALFVLSAENVLHWFHKAVKHAALSDFWKLIWFEPITIFVSQVIKPRAAKCEWEGELCVAIVTVTNLTPGFLPSMHHSHSGALPLFFFLPPLPQASQSLVLCVSLSCISLCFFFVLFCTQISIDWQAVRWYTVCSQSGKLNNLWKKLESQLQRSEKLYSCH